MDAAEALANLTEISAQVEAAVIFERSGEIVASTLGDEERSGRLARAALDLLTAAEARGRGGEPLAQLEAAFPTGSVFVVRDDDRAIAATTGPEPTVGLVFYDLKSCLREAEAPKAKRKAATASKAKPKPATRRKRTSTKKADEGT
jgi:predicted regulator of Ras-like GTPase activity (Roadblock/LC7/MglB family)